ncbi:MAG: YdcF family protein [Acidobacteriota bacterium]|nr:YdcF family protein [Acidobacteriota bacterium]
MKTNATRRALVRRAAVVFLLAWPLVAWAAARALVVTPKGGSAEAVAVLAGSSTYVERARRAAEVFGEGRAPRVVLTNDGQRGGWSREEERNPLFVERAAGEMRARGVPADKIEVLPGTVSSTYEEALRLREYAAARGLRTLLVVTSAYQVRRARWTFEKVFAGSGVTVSFEAVPPGDETPPPLTWWLHTQGWRVVAGEYLKMGYYLARLG